MFSDYLARAIATGDLSLIILGALVLLAILGVLAISLDHRRKMLMIEKGLLKIKIYHMSERGCGPDFPRNPRFSFARISLANRGLLFPGFIVASFGAALSLALYLPLGMGWWMVFGLIPLFAGFALMVGLGLFWI